VQINRPILHKVNAHMKPVQQGRAKQRTPSCCKYVYGAFSPVPHDNGSIHVQINGGIIGEVRVSMPPSA
jgi:hypothetical protein